MSENVEYPTRLAGRVAEMKDWIDKLMGALALDELADRLPFET